MSSRPQDRCTSLGFTLTVLLGTTFTLALAATLHAQVVSDPRIVEFNPSPAHWTMLASGERQVSRYDFEVYLVGASAPFHTVAMGKPSPDADGKVRYDFASHVAAWPVTGDPFPALARFRPWPAGPCRSLTALVWPGPSQRPAT